MLFVTSKSKKIPHVLGIEKELKDYCVKNKLKYLGNIDANDESFVEMCRAADLCVLGGYDKIVHADFINASKYGAINTHFGLIPENRGCNPVMWAILESRPQGFTTYFVSEKIDYGEIIDRYEVKISKRLNSYKTYKLLSELSIDRLLKILETIWDKNYKPADINNLPSNYHKQGMPNDSWISWHWNNEFITRFSDCLIFPPYPCARTIFKRHEIQIKVACTKKKKHSNKIGEIVKIDSTGRQITVAAKEGFAFCEITNNAQIKIGDVFTSKVGNIHPIAIKYAHNVLV